MERKILKGSDGVGNKRVYDLPIISALDGLVVAHTYGSLALNALPQLTAVFAEWADQEEADIKAGVEDAEKTRLTRMVAEEMVDGQGPIIDLIKVVPAILSIDRVLELCKIFLAGAKVNDTECDAEGMCSLFQGRPHEVYAALVYAIIANYPDYLPFSAALDDTTDTGSAE